MATDKRAVDVDVAFHLRPGEQVGGHAPGHFVGRGIGGRRRARAEIHHLGALLAGAMHQREADAAETGVPWLVRGQRERGRHRGVDRVAAGVEHRDAGLRRTLRLRDHHAAAPLRRRLAELPVLRDVRRRCVLHGRFPRAVLGWSAAVAHVAREAPWLC